MAPDPVVAAADRAWSRRDEGRVGARASPTRINEAITGYEKAAESPSNVEARWKLARALFFRAKYTGLGADSQRAAFVKAREAGEQAIALLREAAVTRGGDAPRRRAAEAYCGRALPGARRRADLLLDGCRVGGVGPSREPVSGGEGGRGDEGSRLLLDRDRARLRRSRRGAATASWDGCIIARRASRT